MSVIGTMKYLTIGNSTYEIPGGEGTVTSVGLTNATNGGLTISGSPITSSGSISIGHSNVLTNAQTTQAVYPIKIDKNGHISAYGTAVSIPTKVSDLTNDSGFVTTDMKLQVSVNDGENFYPVLTSNASTASTKYYSNLLYFGSRGGLKSLMIGGTANDSTKAGGAIRLYNAAGGSVTLAFDGTPTYHRSIIIPDKAGDNVTLAVTSDIPTVPTNISAFTNDAGYLTSYTETDPTVPSWAKASSKPSYTAAEVGAVPTTRKVNGKALSADITLSASDVSALPSSTVIPTITDTYSGTSSNGMSGKAVKSAIDALDGTVTGTAGAGKTLTAFSQTDGKVSATFGNISITKSQISDFPTIPTKVSDLTNDSGYITGYTETDPTVPSWAKKSTKPTYTASEVGAAPTTRTVNGYPLSSDVTLGSSDIPMTTPWETVGVVDVQGALDYLDANMLTYETDPVFTASAAHGISSSDISNWNGKQNALVSGTNIKTINNTSLLGSGNININASVTSTSIPTASTIAKFDSSAHMNSTDMTSQEVDDFIDGLDYSNTITADYIVSQGSDGTWTYRKWNSGICEAWAKININYTVTFSTSGNLYRSSAAQQSLPSGLFIEPPIISATHEHAGVASISISNVTNSSVDWYLFRGSSTNASNVVLHFYCTGIWK